MVTTSSPMNPSCLLDISRACGKKKGKNKYTLPQLKDLWNNECKDLEEFAGKKPKTVEHFCGLMMGRYASLKFMALEDVPDKVKALLMKRAARVSSALVVTKAKVLRLEFRVFNARHLGGPVKILEHLAKGVLDPTLLSQKDVSIPRLPPGYGFFKPKDAKKNPKYFYNKNVDRFPKQWLMDQNEYVLALSWRDKVRLLSYTYAGDKIANSFLLGTFDVKNVIDANFSVNYKLSLFPLALDLYLNARTFTSYAKWRDFCIADLWVLSEQEVHDFYRHLRSQPFEEVYLEIIKFLSLEGQTLKTRAWYTWAGEYILHLNAIFGNAPRVPQGGFYVYRGVTDASYVNANRKNVFVNETFMSTSLDITKALTFKNTGANPCCVFSIQVLPGAHCLLAGALTYFTDELEILFAPGRQLFITKNQFMDSNGDLLVTKFSLVN